LKGKDFRQRGNRTRTITINGPKSGVWLDIEGVHAVLLV
jgi:hypothetical protein